MGTSEAESDDVERRRTVAIFIVGLLLALVSEPLGHVLGQLTANEFTRRSVSAVVYGLEHLGVVLVVATLIRVVIEKASQRQFFSLIDTNVKKQVQESIQKIANEALVPVQQSIQKIEDEVGFRINRLGQLDDQSKKELKDKVFSPEFIRTDYVLHLTLEPLARSEFPVDQQDLLKVTTRTQYKATNVTNKRVNFRVKAFIDRMFEPPDAVMEDKCRFTRVVCGSEASRPEDELRPFDILRLHQQGKIVYDEGFVRLDYDLQDGILPQTTYFVEVEAIQVLRAHYIFVWNMLALTNSLEIRIELAGGYSAGLFKIGARGLHHMPEDDFASTRVDQGNVVSWKINQVLLPYQGVEVWWSLKKTQGVYETTEQRRVAAASGSE